MKRLATFLALIFLAFATPVHASHTGPVLVFDDVAWGNYYCDYVAGHQGHAEASGRATGLTINENCYTGLTVTNNRVLGSYMEVRSLIPGIPSAFSFPAFLVNGVSYNWDWNPGGVYSQGTVKIHVKVCSLVTGNCGSEDVV